MNRKITERIFTILFWALIAMSAASAVKAGSLLEEDYSAGEFVPLSMLCAAASGVCGLYSPKVYASRSEGLKKFIIAGSAYLGFFAVFFMLLPFW